MSFEPGHKPTGSTGGQPKTNMYRTDEQQQQCDRAHVEASRYGKARAGMSELKKYLAGGKLTPTQAIRARCVQCNGYGEQTTCSCVECPLYPFFSVEVATGFAGDNSA